MFKDDQNNYTSILSDLYEKYCKSGRSAPPEIKLILTLLGSAMACHISCNAVNNLPDLNELLEKSPHIKEQLDNINKNEKQDVQNNTNDVIAKEQELAAQKMRDLEMLKQSRERYNRQIQNGSYNDGQSNRSERTEELMRKLLEKDNHIRSLQDQLDMVKSESKSMYMSREHEQPNISPPNIPSRYANKFKQPEPVKKKKYQKKK